MYYRGFGKTIIMDTIHLLHVVLLSLLLLIDWFICLFKIQTKERVCSAFTLEALLQALVKKKKKKKNNFPN